MKVLITGARGVVGPSLRRRCEAAGLEAAGAGRSGGGEAGLRWDMAGSGPPFEGGFGCLLHAAPLWLLADHVEALARRGVARIVALSSTSVVTKQASSSERERAVAAALARAEDTILEQSARFDVNTTLLRPTMIYGYGRDANITVIARFIDRFGFFPVAGAASGRRQPVHADDVADAVVAAIDVPVSFGGRYCLAGGETLAYRAMVERVFDGLGRPRRILALPTPLYHALLGAVSAVRRGVSGAMAGRMNADLVFDDTAARRDLSVSPQGFLEQPDRDLVLS